METVDPAGLGLLLVHLGIILGVAVNLIVLVRFIRNGKDKR